MKLRSAIGAGLCALALLAPTAALAARVIAPGSEAAVLALVLPYQDEGEVTPGVRLVSIRIESEAIRMTVKDAAGAQGDITLRPAPAAAATAFEVEVPADAPEAVRPALVALADAVRRNDDDSFRFSDQGDGFGDNAVVLPPLHTERALAAAAWLLALLLGGLWFARTGLRRPRGALPWLLLFTVALGVRLAYDFDPLHANDHAWEDAAVALGVAGEVAASARLETTYGPALRMAQAPLAAALGGHFEALADAGALAGALASLLAGLGAAALAGGGRIGGLVGLLAGLTLALSPAASRVAGSESDLVFAQLALAWVLAVAARTRRIPTGPAVAAGVAILALGHIVGPGWAAGAAGLAVALRHATRLRGEAGDVEPHLLLGPSRWSLPTREALGLALWGALPAAGCGALRLLDAMAMVQDRATADGVGIAMEPTMLLISDPAYFPPVVGVLALLGLVGDLAPRQRDAGGGWRGLGVAVLGTIALWSGAVATTLASLLVVACATDAMRYQSVVAVVWVLLAARAPALLAFLLRRTPATAMVAFIALAVLTGVGILQPRSGHDFADSQITAWRGLRAASTQLGPTPTFVVPRGGAGRAALPDAPRGMWSAEGPTSRVLSSVNARTRCEGGLGLPEGSFLYLPPGCHAVTDGEPPCAPVRPFDAGGASVAEDRVDVVQVWDRQRPLGEFLRFPTGTVRWELRRARCR